MTLIEKLENKLITFAGKRVNYWLFKDKTSGAYYGRTQTREDLLMGRRGAITKMTKAMAERFIDFVTITEKPVEILESDRPDYNFWGVQ